MLQTIKNQLSLSVYIPKTMDEWMHLANVLARSNCVPKAYAGKPHDIFICMQTGLPLGLYPMQSLRAIYVVNGLPCAWGDGLLAIARSQPDFEYINEDIQDTYTTCEIKRANQPPVIRTYTEEDAKKANLLNKGVWLASKVRMQQMRARSFAIRDCYADALFGIGSAEEQQDLAANEAEVLHPMKEVSQNKVSALKDKIKQNDFCVPSNETIEAVVVEETPIATADIEPAPVVRVETITKQGEIITCPVGSVAMETLCEEIQSFIKEKNIPESLQLALLERDKVECFEEMSDEKLILSHKYLKEKEAFPND